MSLRDHKRLVAAGGFEKIQSNDATTFYVKEVTAPIPILRIDYQGGQSGSVRFFNVKQGDKYRAPEGSFFTQLQFENSSAIDIDLVITLGQGDYSQNEISGFVSILGGNIDTIVNPVNIGDVLNPVQVIPTSDDGCFPVKNCVDPESGDAVPLEVTVQGLGGSDTVFNNIGGGNLAGGGIAVAANPDRKTIFVTVLQESQGALEVASANNTRGVYVLPGQTFELEHNGALFLRRASVVVPVAYAVNELENV